MAALAGALGALMKLMVGIMGGLETLFYKSDERQEEEDGDPPSQLQVCCQKAFDCLTCRGGSRA